MSDERLSSIESKIDRVIAVQSEHTAALTDHTRRLDKLEAGHEVLHDSVARIAEGHAAILARLDRGFESLHAVVHERLEPLEEAVRRLNAR